LKKTKAYACVFFHHRFDGSIRSATVSRTKSDKYFISIVVETEDDMTYKHSEATKQNSIGIDLGIKDFVILSDGTKIKTPEIKEHNKKLEKLHRNLSRKQKGSQNRYKARIKLARLYERIDNIKTDFLHKLSRNIVDKNHVDYVLVDRVFMEILNLIGMLKNHKLARSIAEASWFKFYTFLNYKAGWVGKQVLKIGRFEPSSKMCSVCGYKNKELKLSDRMWVCPECKTELDRDINAAVNIRNTGLNTAGTAGFQACGEGVSLVFSKRVFSKAILGEAGSSQLKPLGFNWG